jgi:putative endonuclease
MSVSKSLVNKEKYFTYALHSEIYNRLYIGHTDNLSRRIEQHNKGKVASTKPYIPYKLIYYEKFNSRLDAVKKEKQLKTSKGRDFIKTFI